jgi:hypothetical protein
MATPRVGTASAAIDKITLDKITVDDSNGKQVVLA